MAANEAFALVAEYAVALGAKSIGSLPGCWEKRIDEHWWVAINGHLEEVPCSHDAPVPPLCCYIEYDDWPAGVIALDGGDITSEADFVAAIKRAFSSLESQKKAKP